MNDTFREIIDCFWQKYGCESPFETGSVFFFFFFLPSRSLIDRNQIVTDCLKNLSKLVARKVIVGKFKFFILKLWEFTRLFIAMASVNLVFLSQEPNSNEVLQLDTRGFNAAFSHWILSVSVEQFTVQMSKLNGIGKTHRKHLCRRT